MKKLVMLGIGVSSILSASVLAEGSSFYYAMSNFASSQQATTAMKESSLAAIEGGQLVPFFPFFIVSVPGVPFPVDISQLMNEPPDGGNNSNVTVIRCNQNPCNITVNQTGPGS